MNLEIKTLFGIFLKFLFTHKYNIYVYLKCMCNFLFTFQVQYILKVNFGCNQTWS